LIFKIFDYFKIILNKISNFIVFQILDLNQGRFEIKSVIFDLKQAILLNI
jgi:hypothetical protein